MEEEMDGKHLYRGRMLYTSLSEPHNGVNCTICCQKFDLQTLCEPQPTTNGKDQCDYCCQCCKECDPGIQSGLYSHRHIHRVWKKKRWPHVLRYFGKNCTNFHCYFRNNLWKKQKLKSTISHQICYCTTWRKLNVHLLYIVSQLMSVLLQLSQHSDGI